jgi:hypothetical protein
VKDLSRNVGGFTGEEEAEEEEPEEGREELEAVGFGISRSMQQDGTHHLRSGHTREEDRVSFLLITATALILNTSPPRQRPFYPFSLSLSPSEESVLH